MARKIERTRREHWQLAPEIKQEILVVFLFAFSLISILSLFGLAGKAGDSLANLLNLVFGYSAGIFLLVLIVLAYQLINPLKYFLKFINYLGLIFFIVSGAGLLDIFIANGGGYLGFYSSNFLQGIFGLIATVIFLIAIFLISLLLVFEISFSKIFFLIGFFKTIFEKIKSFIIRWKLKIEFSKNNKALEEIENGFSTKPLSDDGLDLETGDFSREGDDKQVKITPKEKFIPKKISIPLELLDSKEGKPAAGDIKANKFIIQKTLENFGIPVEMGEVNIGPTVGQYTFKPAEGIKISQITTLHNDLALALAVHPIRIEAPIPGKSLVGVEVPNKTAALVSLKELLSSEDFKKRKSNLMIPLGKDVSGTTYLADLAKMPHLLIAGSTGSGKTVMLNSIILSLLFQNSLDDLELILIDPKRVELTAFNDLPYLKTPVIISVEKTIFALKWMVKEMERRLDVLAEARKRDIASYNRESGEKMPYFIVVIDELADLMTTSAQEMENCIIRLAQMARATGIHLIMATQRPSVDIITGLIKANITCRIAFSVASIMDSRTILDFSGAEKLLGRGDMLYTSPELGKPKRLQGAYLSDKEIQMVTDYLRKQAKPEYIDAITQRPENEAIKDLSNDTEGDDLLPEAEEVVLRVGKASATLIQRYLRVGYARAARLLDLLEQKGVIGPGEGSKAREILVKREENIIDNQDNNNL